MEANDDIADDDVACDDGAADIGGTIEEEDAAAIFDDLIGKMLATNINPADPNWSFGKPLQDMSRFMEVFAEIARIVDYCREHDNKYPSGRQILDKKQLTNLYDYLYDIIVPNIKCLSKELVGSVDRYKDTPLVVLYLGVASLVVLINNVWPVEDHYVHFNQGSIPYCVEHGLDVVNDVTISNFSVEELFVSINKIAYSTNKIYFCSELSEYVDALEHRLCELLLNCYDTRIHNIHSFRRKLPGNDEAYVFNSATEFTFITAILSLRTMLTGAIQALRTEMAPTHSDRHIAMAKRVQETLASRADKIYGDHYKNLFKLEYIERSTTTMEGFMFLKTRNFPEKVKCPEAIRQFRSLADWMKIAEATNPRTIKIGDFLRYPEEDFLGFKIAFKMIMGIIFSETIHEQWQSFYFTGETISAQYEHELETMLERSKVTPMYVESLNDACVLTEEKMVIFGKDWLDYLVAFIYWLDRVATVSDYQVKPKVFIHPLLKTLLGSSPNKPIQEDTTELSTIATKLDVILHGSQASSSSSTSQAERVDDTANDDDNANEKQEVRKDEDYFRHLFSNRDQQRARMEELVKILPRLDEELDSVPAFINLDHQGVPATEKSGWE